MDAAPAGDPYRTRGKLFPQYEQGAESGLVFDTDVVTAVELPDGRRYELLSTPAAVSVSTTSGLVLCGTGSSAL